MITGSDHETVSGIQSETNPMHVPDSIPTSSTSYCSWKETGIKQAVRRLNRLNKKRDPFVITISPPAGLPLFLFQPIEGVKGPDNVFYDLGCSDAIF